MNRLNSEDIVARLRSVEHNSYEDELCLDLCHFMSKSINRRGEDSTPLSAFLLLEVFNDAISDIAEDPYKDPIDLLEEIFYKAIDLEANQDNIISITNLDGFMKIYKAIFIAPLEDIPMLLKSDIPEVVDVSEWRLRHAK